MTKKLTKQELYDKRVAEYKKELKRLKSGLKRWEKKGFTNFKLPSPTDISPKELKKIKKLKPNDIVKQSTFVSYDTGEILTGEQGLQYLKAERKRKKEEQTHVSNVQIIEIVRNKILELVDIRILYKDGKPITFDTASVRNALLNLLDDITIQDDIKPVLDYLYSIQGELSNVIERINGDSNDEVVRYNIARAFEILKSAPLNFDEAYAVGIHSDYMGEVDY